MLSPQGHIDYVTSVAFGNNDTQLASGSDDYTVRVWDVASNLCQATLEVAPAPRAADGGVSRTCSLPPAHRGGWLCSSQRGGMQGALSDLAIGLRS